ncbi:MAG: TetR/AcrR family transcriptional regulator [Myxococcota bacterium]
MPNSERRRHLTDAGIEVLAEQGGRGLTHRAVDRRADVPAGTTSNYFRRREDLLFGLIDRVYERLAPSDEVAAALARRTPDRALYADYLRDIVRRLTAQRSVTLALFELRLEAARNPRIAETVGVFLRERFQEDAAFVASADLPGGPAEVALFHYALDGLLLDRLTTPIDPEGSTDAVVDRLVDALLPE